MFLSDQNRAIPCTDLLTYTFGNIEEFLDKPLYIEANSPTYQLRGRDVLSLVRRLVAGLAAHGICQGDHIALLSYNSIYYTALYLAIVGVGACFVGINPAYNDLELRHVFSVAQVKAIICQRDLLHKLDQAAEAFGIPQSAIWIFDESISGFDPAELRSWRCLLEHGERDWISFDDEERARATIAALVSTSGTTGLPKAAAVSHYAHVAQNVLLYDSQDKPYAVRRLLSLPQFHAFAAPLVHVAPIREGHTSWIMKRYHLQAFLECVQANCITETAVVPPICYDFLANPETAKGALASLRYLWCAGAPLSRLSQVQTAEVLHRDALLTQVWGMSEIGWVTAFHYPEKDLSGSVGRLLPNMEARIVRESGDDVVYDDEFGEIYVRGPSLMLGYLGQEKDTSEIIQEGWLRTGDIGLCRDGKWYILDRAKEIIKVRGWQVSPAELEACLLTHSEIHDAAVVGVELEVGSGEVPRAYVVRATSSHPRVSADQVSAYVASRLARFKALAGGVIFVDQIPRSASGKVLRKQLREIARQEVSEARMP